MRVRKLTSIGVALALVIGLITAVTMVVTSHPGLPQQETGTAAGRPHRVSASVTIGHVVQGRGVRAASQRMQGPSAKAAPSRVPGAVPPAARPRPLRLPARGKKPAEQASVLAAPAPAKKTGYDEKTSREIPPDRADQVVYSNADGTRTAFEFQAPVNYRRPDGKWASINTTLVPDGTAGSPSPSGSASSAPPASPSGSAAPASSTGTPAGPGSAIPTAIYTTLPPSSPAPGISPSPPVSPTPAVPSGTVPPASGWTERSAAEPEVFAAYANAADLVSMPLDSSHAIAFGVAGAAAVPGAAQGSSVDYPDAIPGSSIGFTAGTGMVKERIVLDSADAPASWVFPLDLTGLRAEPGPGGIVQFADSAGKVLAYVPHGFMTDSHIDPHSGDGATSYGVSYSLTSYGGRPAIRMTLDAAWLGSKARVYPVTVDPTVTDKNADGSTYVQYPYTNDYSGDTELKAGTFDGGADKAKSFLAFGNVSSALQNDTVLGVRLGIYNSWSYSCSPRPVYVYPVTSSWSVTGNKSWPGPSTGSAIGSKSFATGWVPLGSTVSPCKASWEGISLNQAGTNLVNGWTHGTTPNYGLAIGASTTDSYGWKKFGSKAATSGNPFLAVTYTTDGASYKLASRKPVVQVTPTQNGKIALWVTNTGSSTWMQNNGNGYEISYRAYDSAGHVVPGPLVFTAMPSTVAPKQTVRVDAVVGALPAGSYAIDFDMYSGAPGSPTSFSSQGIPPFAVGLYVPQPPPVVSAVYPPTGYIAPTLAPQLSTVASGTGTVTYSFTVTCKPLPNQTCVANSFTSGNITKPYWTVPRAKMQWNTPYQWSVTATVNGASTTVGPVSLTAEVPQPGITSGLGMTSGQAYNPLSGNYTTSATDAAVASAGPPLQIVRTYNSMDPRTSGAFGAGWSSAVDAALRPDNDGTGNVTVTVPGGQQIRFGQNGDGKYAPQFGGTDVLVHNSDGTWTLRDASGEAYTFGSAGPLSKITDPNGLSQLFSANSAGEVTTITNSPSGRTLTLTWATPPGAASPHVASVTTQAPASGQSGLQWTYTYSGDELSSACGPAGCTPYSYASGSHYLDGVLDSGPRSYWQLGEASGTTTASDEVDVNLDTTNGTYSNVTLGAAGPLAGSGETAAAFNGTSSSVSLPANLITDSTDVAIELWFEAASGAGGVLFGYSADALGNSNGNSDAHVPALYIGGNGELYGEYWNGSVNPIHTSSSVTDGKWHHVVLTASGSSQSMYLDGSQVGSALSGQIDQLNMSVDTIGAGFWGGSWPQNTQGGTATPIGHFKGNIAQVAVYPHPLGLPAIAQHDVLGSAASAELTQVTLPSQNVYEQASYDPDTGRLAGYTDPKGGQWTIGQPLATGYKASSDSVGEVLDRITVTDPAGRQETYGYDMLDGTRLVDYSNGVDPPESYGYDAAGFLTSVVDQDGNWICFTNDSHGNKLTRTWYPNQAQSLPGGGTGTAPACPGFTPSPDCWATGTPCTTFYSYFYSTSNPVDPRNDKVTTVLDGRSQSSTDPNYQAAYAYNPAGQLTSQTTPPTSDFPQGRPTNYAYSTGTETGYGGSGTIPAGLLLSKTTPGGAVTGYQYYANGDLAKVTEPSGRYTVYTYDALGRPLTSTVYTTSFPSGETTSSTYDAMGRPATVTYPAVTNQVTSAVHQRQDSYSYDSDGNLLSLTQADLTGGDAPRTTSYTYNDHGEVATVTQPAGATTGGSSQSEGASSANPQGATTSYGYDGLGNVTDRTDPNGNEYRYTYNEYGEPAQETLYTSPTSQATPTANCTAPATTDADGGCDLVLKSYAYDPAGLLAATTDAMGRITNYTYDHHEDLNTVTTTDPSTSPTTGRQAVYEYDGAGNLIAKTVSAMSGGSAGVTTETDYTIDAAGRLAGEIADPTPAGTSDSGYANRSVSYTYNADDQVASQTIGTADEGGTSVTSYGYDTAGDRTSQTVLDGSTSLTTTWTYNQDGQPLSMTTPAGNVSGGTPANYTTNYGYDPAGNLVTVTGPPVPVRTYSAQTPATTRPVGSYGYDTFGDRTQAKDPDGNVAVTGYDGDGRVTSVTPPSYTPPGASSPLAATTTSYSYDENGNIAQVTVPRANSTQNDYDVTQYGYDALGDVTSVTQPQLPGQSGPGTWSYTYDSAGEQLSAADPLGKTSHATYDYFGELQTATDPLGNTTRYAYDYLGDQVKATSPDGAVITSTYDHLGEPTSTADLYGNTTSYQHGYAGQLTYAFSPDGGFTQYGYDQAGNLTAQTDYPASAPGQGTVPLRSESLGYDPNGDLTSVRDWNGNTSSFTYDAAGKLTSQVRPVSASASITTSYGYDAAGNRTAVTGGNGNTTWTAYNAWTLPESVIEPATPAAPAAANRTWTTGYFRDARPASVSQPGGISLSYGYDPLGNLISETGSGSSAPTTAQSFGYDLDGRLVSATAPGGTDSFTYYDNGELRAATGPSGASSFTYNGDGLVTAETSAAGNTSYTYDAADRLATETDPLTGATLNYAYNTDSQPVSVSYSAGATQTFSYDSLQRLTSDTVKSASGTVLASEAYGYDANGNLTSQATGGLMTAATTSYGYDEANRLTSSTKGGTTTSYAYDGDGNLTQAGATNNAYNAQDQVTSATTTAGTTSYAYTLSGALASVTPPGGSAQNYTSDAYGWQATAPGGISYGYDAFGRLVTRTSGSATTSMSYLGTGSTLASDGTSNYSYTPGGAMTGTQIPGGTGYATLSDLHGDLAATFSPAAGTTSLAGYATYSPYGTPTATGNKPGIGFQGNYTDPATGQVQMGARWYNPATGTFTTNDTIGGNPVSSTVNGNPYAYTSGNPLTQTDPTGHGTGLCAGPYGQLVLCGSGPFDSPGSSTQTSGQLQLGLWTQYESQGQAQNQGQSQAQGGSQGTGFYDPQPCWFDCYPGGGTTPAPGSSGGGPAGGGGGPCIFNCTWAPAPPPPPPPPQDCFAGPAPTCTAPPPPGSLLHGIWITNTVHDVTNAKQLFDEGLGIIEQLTYQQQDVRGSKPIPGENGGQNSVLDPWQMIAALDHFGTQPPLAPTPGNNGNNKYTKDLAKKVSSAVTPVLQTLLQPVFNAIQSTLNNAVSCVTHPRLSSCLQTAALLLTAFVTGGESIITRAAEADTTITETAAAEDTSLAEAAAKDCGGMSFTAGTKVLLADGKKKPIASLKPGDKVLATSTKTGKTSAEPVSAVLVHHDSDLYNLKVRSGGTTTVIETTSNHLFWVPDAHRWVKAAALKYGTHLRNPSGTAAVVVGGYIPRHHDGWMWDLTVPSDHDFYVQSAASAILVHNCAAKANSLEDNMKAAGIPKPAGTVAHHIVPAGARNTAASKAQLRRFGIDINDADNGVFLPQDSESPNPLGMAVHSTLHTARYYRAVNVMMSWARNSSEARDVLGYIRDQLQAGPWPSGWWW
jgi:RHS repeat-associated protein